MGKVDVDTDVDLVGDDTDVVVIVADGTGAVRVGDVIEVVSGVEADAEADADEVGVERELVLKTTCDCERALSGICGGTV